MSELAKHPAILNLAGALSEELVSYFALNEIRVVNPLEESTVLEWTHILTKDVDSFDVIGDTYSTQENDIKIICLGQPWDLQNFIINNGKLVLDEIWLKGDFGKFILDKFFQEFGGVNISDSYPNFRENGSFNITNPFSTGEYLDHLVYNAFESGMSALSVKTYFDHILMYLTSLKNKGKVGFPVEATYGKSNDIYALQMHFYAENLQIEDVISSLSSNISKSPEEYLLFVALSAMDFFDFTYLPEVKKVVMTALWTQDKKVQTKGRGVMFTHCYSSSSINSSTDEIAMPFILNSGELEDISAEILPVESMNEELVFSEDVSADEEEHLIKGSAPEEEEVNVIRGGDPEEEARTVVSGGSALEEKFSTTVKGEKENQTQSVTRISGGQKEEKPFNTIIHGGDGKPQIETKTIFSGQSSTETKKSASLFKVAGPSKRVEDLEKKLAESAKQNEELRSKLFTAMSELKVQKDTQARISKVSGVLPTKSGHPQSEDNSRAQEYLRKEKNLTEKEKRIVSELMEVEKSYKKLELESSQKEMRLNQEMEKLQRLAILKDSILEKSKENFTKTLNKKEEEVKSAEAKLDQVNKFLAGGTNKSQALMINELERQSANQSKMIEMYRNKITNLSAAITSNKEDDSGRDDSRKLQITNDQLKSQVEMMRREISKLQSRSSSDIAQIMTLKQEKVKMMDSLKKAEAEIRKRQNEGADTKSNDVELKRLMSQNQTLEMYLKESANKIKDLENKLQNLMSTSRAMNGAEDGQSKVKITHLEASVKKLTQDLVESRNSQAELKKETNKLRQEKTALQNSLNRAKRDLEKSEKKSAPAKKVA